MDEFQKYSNIVIDTLPMLLNNNSKEKASIIIASYMNGMLRKVNTENELMIFAQTLKQCIDFSSENNLKGFGKNCVEWHSKGNKKFREIRGMEANQSQKSYPNPFENIQQYLSQIYEAINRTGSIDLDDFKIMLSKLEQLEASLMAKGNQFFSKEELNNIYNKILYLREQITINARAIDDILETNGISR